MSLMTGVDRQKVAAYIRWSTDEQADGTTLAVQLEACSLFVRSQGWTFREDLVFVDDGYSGGTLDRPGLNRLRKAVADGLVSCVVVYKLDRLSRSVLDTVNLVLQEWDGVCTVRSAREPIDTSNPTGSILFYLLASYAEWERSTIRERTMSGKIKRAQQGKNPGFPAPYGYARGAETGQWVICEPEAATVRRIFREYAGGQGIHTIAAELNRDGIRPRRADFWRGETIAKLIANPVYAGVLRYGRSTVTTKAQRKQLGKARIFFAEPRYANVESAVPAIVSHEMFERARLVKASRSATAGCRARGADFLLTGIARCKCGATIRGDGRASAGKRYYRCSGNRVSNPERCTCGLIPAHALESAVLSQVRAAVAPENRMLLLAGWEADHARKTQEAAAEIRRLSDLLARVEKNRARYRADYKAGDLPAKLYAESTEELDREEQALRTALEALSAQLERLQTTRGDRADFEQMVQQLQSWDELRRSEQKQLLRYAVARCVVFRESEPTGFRNPRLPNPNPVEVDLEIRRIDA